MGVKVRGSWPRSRYVCLSALVMATFSVLAEPQLQLNRVDGGLMSQFVVANLTPEEMNAVRRASAVQVQESLSVSVASAKIVEAVDLPTMVGKHRVEGERLVFEPLYPLEPGLRYRAMFRPGKLGLAGNSVEKEFTIPARPIVRSTVVEKVYPTSDELPENQLKFYIHFSAPMNQGGNYSHIHLLGANGKDVFLPFLELDEELWDPEGKRLTVFFDPGRIKRGLRPLEDIGPAMVEGESYTLVINANFKDASNNPLKAEFRKRFRVGAPDRKSPDPKEWKLTIPKGGSEDAFVVDFPEPLDHALLQRLLRVKDASGRDVEGKITIANLEKRWTFTPRGTWQAGKYNLVIETLLEDLAGNSVGKPFEVDIFDSVERQIKRETVALPFVVRGR